MNYRWKLFKIYYRKWDRLFALWIAGRLMKLAFRISPELMKAMGIRR